jgi:hypothetical protein
LKILISAIFSEKGGQKKRADPYLIPKLHLGMLALKLCLTLMVVNVNVLLMTPSGAW